MSQTQDSSNGSHPPIATLGDRPLPPVPAQSKPSWLKKYMSRARDPSPGDDIESTLQRHENHQPNRFIAGLWHVNNTVNAARTPATPGICAGNCNGLKL
ncbi:MAG: hypothetical protein Q9196_004571, partial [Gyalolechia fulgens]